MFPASQSLNAFKIFTRKMSFYSPIFYLYVPVFPEYIGGNFPGYETIINWTILASCLMRWTNLTPLPSIYLPVQSLNFPEVKCLCLHNAFPECIFFSARHLFARGSYIPAEYEHRYRKNEQIRSALPSGNTLLILNKKIRYKHWNVIWDVTRH